MRPAALCSFNARPKFIIPFVQRASNFFAKKNRWLKFWRKRSYIAVLNTISRTAITGSLDSPVAQVRSSREIEVKLSVQSRGEQLEFPSTSGAPTLGVLKWWQ